MKNKLPKYDKYKPSGVEWLGEIPEHWEVKRLKDNFNLGKGLTITKENLREEGILCVNYGEIHSKYGVKLNPEVHKLKCVDIQYLNTNSNSLLKNGDFVFADTSEDINGSGNFTCLNSDVPVFAGYHTIIARPQSNVYSKFLAYEFDSLSFRSQIKLRVKGVKVYSITQAILKELLVWFPPLTEQTRIAEFLDRKTAQIDQAIGIKEKQIALLKERRQIMIHRVVTRGISGLNWDSSDLGISGLASESNIPKSINQVNPDSDIYHRNQPKLKPSGVEWIGDIPEHWEVKKLKYVIEKSFSGGTPSTDKLDFWDGGIPWVSSVDVKKDYLFDTTREISIKGLKNSSSNLAPKGAVIFVTRSGILQHTFAISILGKEMAINQDIKCLILKEVLLPEYFQRLVKGNNAQILVEVRQQAATVESIDMKAFFNLSIALPPIEEQKKIVTHIEVLSSKIATAISLKEQEIAKLKEYKSVLINGAVTGKVKVV